MLLTAILHAIKMTIAVKFNVCQEFSFSLSSPLFFSITDLPIILVLPFLYNRTLYILSRLTAWVNSQLFLTPCGWLRQAAANKRLHYTSRWSHREWGKDWKKRQRIKEWEKLTEWKKSSTCDMIFRLYLQKPNFSL